ncbi:MAG: hypothetical protein ABIR18_09545 [Chitinophagaceae bacterium]
MTYHELKITAYLYNGFSNYDKNYLDIYNKQLDLTESKDLVRVIKFLNQWGCRQFKKEDHTKASDSIQAWFYTYRSFFPKIGSLLFDQDDGQIRSYKEMFNALMISHVSTRVFKSLNRKSANNTVGPVGAAKILFALRRNTFPPWDGPVIKNLKFKKNGDGYCDFLVRIKQDLLNIKEYCIQNAINFDDLPNLLDRPRSSFPKLADEYYWIKITKKYDPAKIIELSKSFR